MEFITTVTIVEKVKSENEETAKKNYSDPQFMKDLKYSMSKDLRRNYSDLDDKEIEISYELRESE